MRFLLSSLLLLSVTVMMAQRPIRYEVSFPNYIHHEAHIKVSFPNCKGNTTVRMSRSSPGRYATHEFGKNVYEVAAYDSATGKKLTIVQQEGDVYMIPYTTGTLVVEYTLFGDHVDGTYTGIDRNHAHLNMPASFLWALGKDAQPIQVSFTIPSGTNWKIATQLKQEQGTNVFSAPNLQYLMDSPTELSDFHMRSWKVKDKNGKEQTIQLVLHADVTNELMDAFAENVKAIVVQAGKVFGELPTFDYGVYTFIIDAIPGNNGDGMEHRNSTCITGAAEKMTTEALKNRLGVISHEFFHSWNVERIRPKTLEPFNFSKANMSDELWVAEGFTQYYGDLVLVRAGLITENDFLAGLSRYLNGFMNYPGSKYRTPIQASRLAVYTDAARAIDKTNFGNIFYSYYVYGASIASLLDMKLRNDHHKSLDDFMQLLWKKYGKTGIAYTVPNLQSAMAELTNAETAKQFFDDYIYSEKRTDLAPFFAPVGVIVTNIVPEKASIGFISTRTTDGGAEIVNTIQRGTPLYTAGLESGDIIKQMDGQTVAKVEDINAIVDKKKIGESIRVQFTSRGNSLETTVTVTAATGVQMKIAAKAGEEPEIYRTNWLGFR